MYAPFTKGSRLYIKGLIYFILTNGQENKIWLEKKTGLKRDYRISIIIDSSRSCFNELMRVHSYQIVVEILSIFSYIQIPYLDIIIAREHEPLILCLGQDSLNSLTINSPIWLTLFEILGNPENN
jgi:midasin (ATPase involved in ribosome maturation)